MRTGNARRGADKGVFEGQEGMVELGCTAEGCSYTTTKRSNLAVHARTHTGERPYSCEEEGCGFTSATRSNLAAHTRRVHARKL